MDELIRLCEADCNTPLDSIIYERTIKLLEILKNYKRWESKHIDKNNISGVKDEHVYTTSVLSSVCACYSSTKVFKDTVKYLTEQIDYLNMKIHLLSSKVLQSDNKLANTSDHIIINLQPAVEDKESPEITQLKADNKQYIETIANLTDKNTEFMDIIQEYKTKLHMADIEFNKQKTNLTELTEKYVHIEQQYTIVRQNYYTLVDSYMSLNSKHINCAAKYTKVFDTNNENIASNIELKRLNTQLSEQLNALKVENDALHREITVTVCDVEDVINSHSHGHHEVHQPTDDNGNPNTNTNPNTNPYDIIIDDLETLDEMLHTVGNKICEDKEDLVKTIDTLTSENTKLQSQLDNCCKSSPDMENSDFGKNLMQRITNLDRHNMDLLEEITRLTTELDTASSENEYLRSGWNTLYSKQQELAEINNKITEEYKLTVNKLKTQLRDHKFELYVTKESLLANATPQVDVLANELELKDKLIANHENTILLLKNDVEQTALNYDELELNYQNLETKFKSLNKLICEKQDAINKLESLDEQNKLKYTDLLNKYTFLLDTCEISGIENNALKDENDTLKTKNTELNNVINPLKNALRSMHDKLETYVDKNTELTQDLTMFKEHVIDLTKELSSFKADNIGLTKKLTMFQEANMEFNTTNMKLQADGDRDIERIALLNAHVIDLENELAKFKNRGDSPGFSTSSEHEFVDIGMTNGKELEYIAQIDELNKKLSEQTTENEKSRKSLEQFRSVLSNLVGVSN